MQGEANESRLLSGVSSEGVRLMKGEVSEGVGQCKVIIRQKA